MANIFNLDFRDFLQALRNQQVKYILVGDYSVILHGYSRTTGDMDVWVEKTLENYNRLEKAFLEFGMPTFDMTTDNFLNNSNFDVFTFGRQPVAIDVITSIKGLEFGAAFKQAKDIEVEGLVIRLIHYNDLIKAKEAAGRPRDIDDIDHLTKK
jgi:predicted nucleotidyltransferase